MSILIIDQINKFIKKIKKIVGWDRNEDPEDSSKDDQSKKIPTIPIILNNYHSVAVAPDPLKRVDQHPNELINNTLFWAKATASSKEHPKVKTNSFRKFVGKFMRRNKRVKGRGA